MIKKTHNRIRGNKDYKYKKRLQDDMMYEGSWCTVLEVLKHDPEYVWDSFKGKKIRLASDSERRLEQIMKKDHAFKYNIYHKNKREKKAREEKLKRIAAKAGVDISKVHLRD
mgnify:CR=1 FL=1|jgi:hypothetical protein